MFYCFDLIRIYIWVLKTMGGTRRENDDNLNRIRRRFSSLNA